MHSYVWQQIDCLREYILACFEMKVVLAEFRAGGSNKSSPTPPFFCKWLMFLERALGI